MNDLDASKAALRARMRARRRALDPATAREASERVQCTLLAHPRWTGARIVALYAALPGEVETDLLLADALARGAAAAFPAVVSTERALAFYRVESGSALSPGAYGIAEPPRHPACAVPAEALELMVVPCVACDRALRRLGRGGGHYDATLARLAPSTWKVGLCFAWQIVEEVPAGPRDARLDAVATEDGVIEL